MNNEELANKLAKIYQELIEVLPLIIKRLTYTNIFEESNINEEIWNSDKKELKSIDNPTIAPRHKKLVEIINNILETHGKLSSRELKAEIMKIKQLSESTLDNDYFPIINKYNLVNKVKKGSGYYYYK